MCLEKIDKKIKDYSEGFKVVRKRKGRYYPVYYDTDRPFNKRRTWDKDTKIAYIRTDDSSQYPAGFHFWACKTPAFNEIAHQDQQVVVKVKVRKVVATGTQYAEPGTLSASGVAKELMILEEIRR